MDYLFHVLVLIGIFAMLAVSLDLLVGRTGLMSVAHAGFFGLGAYASALLAIHFGTPFLVTVVAAMLLGSAASIVVSLTAARLQEDYFVIGSFAFQMILFTVFNNWIDVTRGPLGLAAIPAPVLIGISINSGLAYCLLTGVFVAITCLIVQRITRSPFGRVLLAIREDEVFAASLGKRIMYTKSAVIAISSAIAALSGSLYAHYMSYIDPRAFTISESILVVSMVVIGGAGSSFGPPLGAALLVILPEGLRLVGLPNAVAANVRQILYGVVLLLVLLVRPRGLVGRYGFGR